ncbi:3-alpha-hydroxysteroid sulfotransferase-like [Sarcophilus harrisii]|uniref:3-alpha-hydroxysteroid sulfotransferase-like n=1 Tax=Sarcophilus harrisii TaxID=9305 RepID=UPI001301BD6C|nr:3-alpha-hydroxysteroid sulfotransferase-like [Sarcophilus harrisii]
MEMVKNKANSHLFTSHLPAHLFPKSYFTSKAKILYVARNPRDVLVSLYHLKNYIPSYPLCPSFEHFFEDFLQGNVPLGSWFDHIKGWLVYEKFREVFVPNHEELHQDPL